MTNDEQKGLHSIREAVDKILYVNSTLKRRRKTQYDKQRDMFIGIINTIEYLKTRTQLSSNDLDIDLSAYDDKFFDIIDSLMYLKYGKDCAELIVYYLWERVNPDGSINPLYTDQGEEVILQTPSDLWSLMSKIKPNLDK
jgi:hypothetical protein